MAKIRNTETEGLITEKFEPHEDKGVVHHRTVNHKPILDYNKKLYTQNDGYSPDKGLKRVASIPTIVLEIWCKEYTKDQNNSNWFALPKDTQHKILRKKLNSSDYRYFRTAPGQF
jgi:hypothetical protein|tara:strand:+ start:179 stop:523 length:345 start_codon:yes stop_codon:yes gene_type:complete